MTARLAPSSQDYVAAVYEIAEESIPIVQADRFLVEVIGLPRHRAHEEAEEWSTPSRTTSRSGSRRSSAILRGACTGTPSPGRPTRWTTPTSCRSAGGRPGERVFLMRMTEDLGLDADVMEYFRENGLMPDAVIKVKCTAPDGTLTLEVDGQQVGPSARPTDNLRVRPAGGAG
jgi:hypothetical protein